METVILNDPELIGMVNRAHQYWKISNRYKSYRQFRKWLWREYSIHHTFDSFVEFTCDQGRVLFLLTWT